MCLLVVGALPHPPLFTFLFAVFQNARRIARPPATPRRLGPPLTESEVKNALVTSFHTAHRSARPWIYYLQQVLLPGPPVKAAWTYKRAAAKILARHVVCSSVLCSVTYELLAATSSMAGGDILTVTHVHKPITILVP